MGRFSGLASIRTNVGGIWFLPGNYLVRLERIKFDNTRKGDAFIVEGTVVESDNPQRGPGSKPSWVVVIRPEYLETCLGDIKSFAGAVLEIPDPDTYMAEIGADDQVQAAQSGESAQESANNRFWEQSLEFLCSAEQPAKGVLIRLSVVSKEREGKEPFSKHFWGPVVHEDQAA